MPKNLYAQVKDKAKKKAKKKKAAPKKKTHGNIFQAIRSRHLRLKDI